MSIGQRIIQIRKDGNLNQTDFGKRVGLKQSAIGQYENGKRSVSEQSIQLICKEFGVNENWLRTGDGEMYVTIDDNDEVAGLVFELLQGEPNPFYDTILDIMRTYAELDPTSQEVLTNFALKLRDNIKKN